MKEQASGLLEVATWKRKINNQLESIKVMLVHRKGELSNEQWLNFVSQTRESILEHPDQYLDKDLPKTLVATVVENIFEEFLMHQERAT